jgi:glycosyl transferase family 1
VSNRLLTRHRRRLLKSPGTYRSLAIDAAWTMRRSQAQRPALTWPLDRERLAGITVRWPATYLSGSTGLQPMRRSRLAVKFASLRGSMSAMVRTEIADIEQPYEGIVLLEVSIEGRRHEVAIDQRDFLDVNERCAEGCLLYFKRQFALEGYPRSNVVPGGYTPLKQETLHRHLVQLRRSRNSSHDVYGRFSLGLSPEVRGRVLELLTTQRRFGFTGGSKLTMYTQHLREIAGSKVCIDVPGVGPLSYRLVEYLAVGSCVVSYPHRARLHVPLVDGEHVAYVNEDLSDLVDLCDHYLRNPDERERLAANAQSYFDTYLHRDQLAAYHLHEILEQAQTA